MLPTLSWQSFETPPLKQRFKYFPSHKIILLVFISVPVSDAWKTLLSPQANNTHMQLLSFISFCLPQEALLALRRRVEKEGHLGRVESMSENGSWEMQMWSLILSQGTCVILNRSRRTLLCLSSPPTKWGGNSLPQRNTMVLQSRRLSYCGVAALINI